MKLQIMLNVLTSGCKMEINHEPRNLYSKVLKPIEIRYNLVYYYRLSQYIGVEDRSLQMQLVPTT